MHRGDQGGHGEAPAHGPAAVRRRGLRQDGGGTPGRDEVHPGREAGRHPGAYHRPGPAALRHRCQPVPGLSGEDRGAVPLHPRQGAEADPGGRQKRRRGPADRHAQAAAEEHGVQRPGPAGDRRGTAVRRHPQGAAEGDEPPGGRADPLRHSDPPDAEHGTFGPAGHVHPGGAPGGPAAGADLCAGARLGHH